MDSAYRYRVYAFAQSNTAVAPPADAAAAKKLYCYQRRAGAGDGFSVLTVRPPSQVVQVEGMVLSQRYSGTTVNTMGAPARFKSFTWHDVYAVLEDDVFRGNMTYKYGDEDLDPLLPGSRILRRRVRTFDYLAPRADIENFTVIPAFSAVASSNRDTAVSLGWDWRAARAAGLAVTAANVRDDFETPGVYSPTELSGFSPGYQTWELAVLAAPEPVGAARMFAEGDAQAAAAWAAVEAQTRWNAACAPVAGKPALYAVPQAMITIFSNFLNLIFKFKPSALPINVSAIAFGCS